MSTSITGQSATNKFSADPTRRKEKKVADRTDLSAKQKKYIRSRGKEYIEGSNTERDYLYKSIYDYCQANDGYQFAEGILEGKATEVRTKIYPLASCIRMYFRPYERS